LDERRVPIGGDGPVDGRGAGGSGAAHRYRAAVVGRFRAFRYAFAGIKYAFGQPNFRIQLTLGVVALLLAALFRLPLTDWLALILVSLAVLTLEMLNTVIEAVVDLISPDYHPLAKTAKDVAAGAVLLGAIASVIVGVFIFVPRIWQLLGH
jgi:diacylglycerol kinase